VTVRPRIPHLLLASAFAVAAFGAVPALSAAAAKPGDVKGESTDDKHKDAMQLDSTRCDTRHAQAMNGVASDPEEGGQVTAAKKGTGKVHISDMQVTKRTDVSSPKLMESSSSGGPCSSVQH
jgi:type VI protein secretion system component Hcp